MTDYPNYVVWFRGRPACPCLAEWLPVFEAELIRRGVIRESVDIAQLIGDADASGGTHSRGGAFDIWQHDDVTVWVARQMGAPATWARTTGSFATNKHTHGVLLGCPHNEPARYQIDEVRADGDGLVGNTPDPGPRPIPNRTWREGIAWAEKQGDDMSQYAEQLDSMDAKLDRLLKASKARDVRLRDLIKRKFAATDDDVDAIFAEVSED